MSYRPALALMVKIRRRGVDFYADGKCGWVLEQVRAFRFTDASSGPNREAYAWARGHIRHLRSTLGGLRKLRIVRLVARKAKAA